MKRGRIISAVAIALLVLPAACACMPLFGVATGATVLVVSAYVGVNGVLWVTDEIKR
jgi:hypothetical protein